VEEEEEEEEEEENEEEENEEEKIIIRFSVSTNKPLLQNFQHQTTAIIYGYCNT